MNWFLSNYFWLYTWLFFSVSYHFYWPWPSFEVTWMMTFKQGHSCLFSFSRCIFQLMWTISSVLLWHVGMLELMPILVSSIRIPEEREVIFDLYDLCSSGRPASGSAKSLTSKVMHKLFILFYYILGCVLPLQEVALRQSPPSFSVLCYPCAYRSLLPHNAISRTTFWSSDWS